jgi:benzoyl-CoA reductase/2-hydroxyglutaryl-CoA dehydratase subunit BcrC/BadD/HgdB
MSDIIGKFQQAYENRNRDLRALHSQGRSVIGYFCTYTPVELIKACGFLPIRITGGRGKAEQCYNYLPEFICPFMKQALEKALDGEYDFLSGIVQSYTCDAVCGCQAVWQNNFPGMSLYSFALPYNDNSDAREFYAQEFRRFIENRDQTYDSAFQDVLWRTIDQYRNIREMILEIDRLRHSGFLPVSAEGMWYVVQAGFLLPPAPFRKMLNELLDRKTDRPVLPVDSFPVIVSGSEIGHPDILRYIEQSRGRIVWDDHCTGLRSVEPADGSGEDPL